MITKVAVAIIVALALWFLVRVDNGRIERAVQHTEVIDESDGYGPNGLPRW